MYKKDYIDGEFDVFNEESIGTITKPNITMLNFYYFPLSDLEEIEDEQLRHYALSEYLNVLNNVPSGLGTKAGASIYHIVNMIENHNLKHISSDNHHYIVIYNKFYRYISSKERHCHLCGEQIYVGQPYLIWRPLLFDKTAKQKMVIANKIIIKEECRHYIPENISDFEEMRANLHRCAMTSWNTQINDSYWFPNNHPQNYNEVRYEEFCKNVGGFHMMILPKRKKKINTTAR